MDFGEAQLVRLTRLFVATVRTTRCPSCSYTIFCPSGDQDGKPLFVPSTEMDCRPVTSMPRAFALVRIRSALPASHCSRGSSAAPSHPPVRWSGRSDKAARCKEQPSMSTRLKCCSPAVRKVHLHRTRSSCTPPSTPVQAVPSKQNSRTGTHTWIPANRSRRARH